MHFSQHRRMIGAAVALTASAALVATVPAADATAKAPAPSAGGAAKASRIAGLPRAQRALVRKAIASRQARRATVHARAAFTQRLWYDYYQGSYRFATSASASYLQGYTYISVWNPIVRTINGLDRQRVAFRSMVYNPNTGAVAVSDWWVGTTHNWGSYDGPGFLGGTVTNNVTGARNNGDGAMTFRGQGSGWWAYIWVEWHTATGGLQRQVGTWLQ